MKKEKGNNHIMKLFMFAACISLLTVSVYSQQEFCTDSDNSPDYSNDPIYTSSDFDSQLTQAKDSYVVSTIKILTGSATDSCYLPTNNVQSCTSGDYKCSVKEFFCTSRVDAGGERHYDSGSRYILCPNGCSNGVCLKEATIAKSCSDTDGGKDYYVKGTITVDDYSKQGISNYETIRTDFCLNDKQLHENFCTSPNPPYDNGYYTYETYVDCPNGCSNGACIKSTTLPSTIACTDSDGGKNYNQFGTVSGYSSVTDAAGKQSNQIVTFSDCCISSSDQTGKCVDQGDTLVERYCQDNYWNSFVYSTCNCQNGACLKETTTNRTTTGKPDFTITDLSVSNMNPVLNEVVKVKFNVKNVGTKDFIGSQNPPYFGTDYVLYRIDSITTGTMAGGWIRDLKINQTESLTFDAYILDTTKTTFKIVIDASKAADEIKEENNEKTLVIYTKQTNIEQPTTAIPVLKCGMNSFSVTNECTDAATGASNFRNAYFQCYDGLESYRNDPTSCKSSELWQKYGQEFCAGHCNTGTQTTCPSGSGIWLTQNNPITTTINGLQHTVEILDVTEANDACQVKVDDTTGIIDINEQKTINGVLVSVLAAKNIPTNADICQICTSNWQIQDKQPTVKNVTSSCPSAVEVEVQMNKCKESGVDYIKKVNHLGCIVTECIKKEKENKTEKEDKVKEEKTQIGCNACLLNNACLPVGTRANKQYCDIDNKMKDVKADEASCLNNFECTSNLCVNDSCVAGNVWQKFLSWISGLFGG